MQVTGTAPNVIRNNSGQGCWLGGTFQWVQKQCPVTRAMSDVLQGSVSGVRRGHFSTRNKRYFYCKQRN